MAIQLEIPFPYTCQKDCRCVRCHPQLWPRDWGSLLMRAVRANAGSDY